MLTSTSCSQVRSEFSKDFRQHVENYPKQNQTDVYLDKMQTQVSGVLGRGQWRKKAPVFLLKGEAH